MELIKDRVIGSLVGLAVGDALGTTIEFSERDSQPLVVDMVGRGPFQLNPGEWTDDTSMALCLADSLVRHSDLDEAHLLTQFALWKDQGLNSVKGYCFDIGGTTASGIRRWQQMGTVVNNTEERSAGNGGIMRLAPAAMAAWASAESAADLAVRQSATTHASLLCVQSAELLARWLVGEYHGDSTVPYNSQWEDAVKNIAVRDYHSTPRHVISSSGYVIDTLDAAAWAVSTSDNFETAVLKAVNLGDDADTVGAVTGQLAGARWGLSSIPVRWCEQLYKYDRIIAVAEELYEIGSLRNK